MDRPRRDTADRQPMPTPPLRRPGSRIARGTAWAPRIGGGALVLSLACASAHAQAFSLDERAALDWLVKSVCVSSDDKALPVDPFAGCGPGASLRKLKIGEALPYRNHDQPQPGKPNGFIFKDNVPVIDRTGGRVVLSTIDWNDPGSPGTFKPYHDGFDLLAIRNGWVSELETRSREEFNTVFFGDRCRYDTGIGFFPIGADLRSGQTRKPILGVSWEQLGEDWPGTCDPGKLNDDVLTTWQYSPGFRFGGMGGAPEKAMDAIEVTMGFRRDRKFLATGHLETFYFTRLYGLTRWEGWAPAQQGKRLADGNRCQGPTERSYNGVDFYLSDCRDYSATTVLKAPKNVPAWPASDLNLLKNFHFGNGLADWTLEGDAREQSVEVERSSLAIDVARGRGGKGLAYLRWPVREPVGSLTQELPVEAVASGTYHFGLMARAEAGDGRLAVVIQQTASDGSVVAENEATFDVNDKGYGGRYTGKESLVFASQFVTSSSDIRIDKRRTVSVVFKIIPRAAGNYQIFSGWLMRKN